MNKSDFDKFTKDEIVSYLLTHQIFSTETPLQYLYDKRMDEVRDEINKLNSTNKALIDEMQEACDKRDSKRYWEINVQLDNNHKKWERLNKKYDDYRKLLYGEDK